MDETEAHGRHQTGRQILSRRIRDNQQDAMVIQNGVVVEVAADLHGGSLIGRKTIFADLLRNLRHQFLLHFRV